MGGLGSGRPPWSPRDTVEDCRGCSLAIRDWVARGLVQLGNTFTQQWLDEDGRPEASIDVRIATVNPVHPAFAFLIPATDPVPERLVALLRYRAERVGEAPRDIDDSIWLDEKRSGVQGHRLRFICPGCTRRVAALYLDGVHFRCRKCCGLGYRSQRKTREARGLEKAARIKQQLGGSGEYADPVPERPKGMHRRTYERLCNEAEKAGLPYQERLLKGLPGLLARLGALPQTESEGLDEDQFAKALQRFLESPEPPRQRRRARRGRRAKNGRSRGARRRRDEQQTT